MLFGWLSDRSVARGGGRRRWIVGGLVATAASYALVAVAPGAASTVAAVLLFQVAINAVLAPLLPIMIALTLLIIILQVRSISAMVMVFLTSPLGLIGVVPVLLLFQQPFGINALVGLIALSGILMRNTLILIGQIHHNEREGLDPFQAVVEAAHVHGRKTVAVEDPVTGALTYKRLLAGAAILGAKLMPLAPEGRAIGVMLPNANGAVVTILGLMSAGRVPAAAGPGPARR